MRFVVNVSRRRVWVICSAFMVSITWKGLTCFIFGTAHTNDGVTYAVFSRVVVYCIFSAKPQLTENTRYYSTCRAGSIRVCLWGTVGLVSEKLFNENTALSYRLPPSFFMTDAIRRKSGIKNQLEGMRHTLVFEDKVVVLRACGLLAASNPLSMKKHA